MNTTSAPNNRSKFLVFIIGAKNEQLVVNYISEHFDEISLFRLLVTETDTKALEKFAKAGLEVTYLPSLDKRGDLEVMNKVVKNQISSIVIMNYSSISKQFPPDRLAILMEKSWMTDTCICMNNSNLELVVAHLVSIKGLAGSRKQMRGSNNVMQTVILTRFPTFDIALSEEQKAKREKPGRWTDQQFDYWLDASRLTFLKPCKKNLDPPDKYKEFRTDNTRYFTGDDELTNFFKIKSAPLNVSIDYLTTPPSDQIRDIWDYSTYERDFLISHHIFMTSIELLRELRKRYHLPSIDPDSSEAGSKPGAAVLVVLRDWILMEYGSDFSDNDELCVEFEDMMKHDISTVDPETAKELLEMYQTATALHPPYPVNLEKAPRVFAPKRNKLGKYDFRTSFVAQEVARQMTLMDEQLFHKVRAKEFLGGAWAKKEAMVKAPNLTKFIAHTNRMAGWVVTEILKEKHIAATAELIIKFIQIGKELLELRNYNGVMNILTALHSATIGRLKSAWATVPSREKKDFEDLTESLSLLGHYKNYRETLKTLPPSTPCIPLIPVTCSDLNGLGEVLENFTEEKWINWDKHSKVSNHIWSVKRFMRARYIYTPADAIKHYIEEAEVWEGEKTLAAVARLRERFGGNIDQQVTKKAEKKEKTKDQDDKKPKEVKMSGRDWDLLSPGSDTRKYNVGEVVLAYGVVNRHLFRVKRGTVRVEKAINGKVVVIDKMEEKSNFGEISMLLRNEQATTTASIIADSPGTEVIKYKIDFVLEMCRHEPSLSEKLHKIIALKLSERLRNFGKKKYLSDELEKDSDDEDKIDKPEPSDTLQRRPSRQILVSSSTGSSTFHPPELESKKSLIKLEKKTSQAKLAVSSKKPKKDRIDDEYKKWFRLPDSEIVLKTFTCVNKSTINQQGTLYLSKGFLCFSANVFGRKTKDRYPFSTIQDITSSKTKIEITLKKEKVIFKDFDTGLEDAYTMIKKVYTQKKKDQTEGVTQDEEIVEDAKDQDDLMDLTDEDWKLIIEGTRSIYYKKDEPIIMQGQSEIYRLFQISKGTCRIEKTNEDEVLVLAKLQSPEIFGEIAFLEGSGATASVVADEDDTLVHVIEGFYLDILFDYYPHMSGRFYHYLATVLSARLKMREANERKREETESEDLGSSKDDFGTIKTTEAYKARHSSHHHEVTDIKKRTKSLRPINTDNKKKGDKKERKKRVSHFKGGEQRQSEYLSMSLNENDKEKEKKPEKKDGEKVEEKKD